MNRTEKEEVNGQLHAKMAKAKAAILAEPKGLDVATVTELRMKCREAQVEYRIVKNTLAIRAAKGTSLEALAEKFTGPTALIMSYDDVVVPAKIISEFAKDHPQLKLVACVVDAKEIYGADGIKQLATLPGLPELRAQLLALINTPATQIVRLVNTPAGQVARAIDARREKLEGGAA